MPRTKPAETRGRNESRTKADHGQRSDLGRALALRGSVGQRYPRIMSQRVLIADDSAVARVAVARRVRAEGLEVIERDSVATANTVDPSTLACALLDFDLGDGFGVDVAAHLRETEGALPIAFFTSTSEADIRDRASAFGPVFAKPDELDLAIDWVARHSRG
jgi:CheY-like chemotaxis protein